MKQACFPLLEQAFSLLKRRFDLPVLHVYKLMKKIPLLLILLLTAVFHASAQSTAPDGPELTRMLTEFLAGASRNDAAAHERFWADDLVYTRGAGLRIGKDELMKGVRSSAPLKAGEQPSALFSAEDIRVQQFGNVAIVAYRLVGKTEKDGKPVIAKFLNTDVFVKRDSRWQVVSHQVTPIPEPKQPVK